MSASYPWTFGDIFEGIDAVLPPDAPAVIHDGRVLPWGTFARRTNNLAAQLVARGAMPDDKLAIYTRNRPEYIESLVAGFKARLVHVNVNFRYLDEELAYILDNSDARFVVFDPEFANRTAALAARCKAGRPRNLPPGAKST
jgi:fatty-acyl-CoA synthase